MESKSQKQKAFSSFFAKAHNQNFAFIFIFFKNNNNNKKHVMKKASSLNNQNLQNST